MNFKIIVADQRTAFAARKILECQDQVVIAEIWLKESPLYLFDAHAFPGQRITSLKEHLDQMRSVARETAKRKLSLEEITLLGI